MVETRVSLIERVRDREDPAAWNEFFDVYRPLLTAYVRKRGVSEHDAADVVQDVFARLVRNLADFEFDPERGRFRTWLWRVTHNALTDWARRRATRDRAERVWVDQFQPADDGASEDDWNALYRRRILEVVLERVRATTQPATWECFAGRILADRPAAEIAAETGVSVNAVYVNASRVLARVREECEAFHEPLSVS
jgi:RNA polymerase sigma-70 factor (ECF subfamily)